MKLVNITSPTPKKSWCCTLGLQSLSKVEVWIAWSKIQKHWGAQQEDNTFFPWRSLCSLTQCMSLQDMGRNTERPMENVLKETVQFVPLCVRVAEGFSVLSVKWTTMFVSTECQMKVNFQSWFSPCCVFWLTFCLSQFWFCPVFVIKRHKL